MPTSIESFALNTSQSLTQTHTEALRLPPTLGTHLDLLRLASAAAACSSWVDLLAGTPNTALWVTSLRMRRCPARCALGEDGGVSEPSFCPCAGAVP